MILHNDYAVLVDDFKSIKNLLELQETVEALQRETGQTPDLFTGIEQAVRPPRTNYVIGHGMVGLAEWEPADFAEQLVGTRGLQSNDQICLITCQAGADGSVAEELAANLGSRGAIGVQIRATPDYINWNSNGPLLLKSYATTDRQVAAAAKAWSDAEDKASNSFVANFKAVAAIAITSTHPAAPDAVTALVLQFAAQRPDDNQKSLQGLVAKAKQTSGPEQVSKLSSIIAQAAAVRVLFDGIYVRDVSHARFAAELKQLTVALYALAPDPVTAAATAETEINKVRRRLREQLAAVWPAYSAGYYDRLRTITTDPAAAPENRALAGAWKTFASAAPPVQQPVIPVTQPDTAVDNQVLTDDQLDALMAQLNSM